MSLRACALPALVLALSLTVGCGGEPPDKEMQQAQGALDAAQAAGADKYAVSEFTAAQQALVHAHDAVGQRDYRLALDRALDSRERAQNAAREAADGKASARSAAERALDQAQAKLDAAVAKFEAAEAGKVPARLLAASRISLDTVKTSLQEVRALLAKGDYLQVPARATAATASLDAASAAIEAAAAPPPRRRR
ncbi:MAG: hypothetical protein ABL982_13185 [Vicinamibacterales bacterium]